MTTKEKLQQSAISLLEVLGRISRMQAHARAVRHRFDHPPRPRPRKIAHTKKARARS